MEQPCLPFLDEVLRRCPGCHERKPLAEFHRNRTKADGRQYWCKACNIDSARRWYSEHPEARARLDPYARARRLENHRRIFEYLLAHPCVDCGEVDPVVLDFDHLRDKVRNVSSMLNHTWSRVLEEIDKCEVVCANCHRRRTARRAGTFRYRMTR